MLFRPYYHRNPVAISYFFGCGSKSQGVVVDPMADQVDFYIRESEALNMQIRYVFDTHLHADHVSGARRLAEKTGAAYVLHRSADVGFDCTRADDGDEIEAGNTVVKILHTPGHTPEHVSLLVTDRVRGGDPWFVLTGHTLMVGDVGRTELAAEAKQGAEQLFHSLHDKLLTLPDHLEVFPGAYSGSVCGRNLSGKPSSTIGFEKKWNRALLAADVPAFQQLAMVDVPKRPLGFAEIRAYNMGRADRIPVFIDVRDRDEFDRQPVSGSLHIPLDLLEQRADSFRQADVTVLCDDGGGRSAQAKAILERQGFSDVKIFPGGCRGWLSS